MECIQQRINDQALQNQNNLITGSTKLEFFSQYFLSPMYEFVTFIINLFFLQEFWAVSSIGFQKHNDAYVALGICNQVEFVILCQANSIFEHTGNFLVHLDQRSR